MLAELSWWQMKPITLCPVDWMNIAVPAFTCRCMVHSKVDCMLSGVARQPKLGRHAEDNILRCIYQLSKWLLLNGGLYSL